MKTPRCSSPTAKVERKKRIEKVEKGREGEGGMQAWGGSLKCDTNKNMAEVAMPLDSWREQMGTSDKQNNIVYCLIVDIKCTKGQTYLARPDSVNSHNLLPSHAL